jgi:hypothetical protein
MPTTLQRRGSGIVIALTAVLLTFPLRATGATATENDVADRAALVFSPPGGVFADSVHVQLHSPTPGAIIRFTLNGAEPSPKSEAFSDAIRLTGTTLLRARAFQDGKPAGLTVAHTYTVIEKELEKFASNLPLVILNTFGREVERENKIPASARFIDVDGGRNSLLRPADFDGRGDVNLRGNTSLRYLKRSFAFKTRDESWQAQAVSILGFPKDSDWILYAPYPDKTLLRDVLAYDLSRQMGRYASRTKFVELFLNQVGGRLGKRHYLGVYVLEEKIKRGKERVNLQKLGANDNAAPNITGGYIFKKDHWDTMGNVTPTVEGRPGGFGGGSGTRYGYPTGPGGFPADPNGFLPSVGGGGRRAGRSTGPPDGFMFDNLRHLLDGNEGAPAPRPGEGRQVREFRDPNTGERLRIETGPGRGPEGGGMREPRFFGGRGFGNAADGEVFRTGQGNEFFYVEPKPDEITPAQKAWLQRHLAEFEGALYGPNFKDPVKGYAAYIDPDSFIDHHLLVELTKNIDGFRFSTFFQKDRGGKIKMEPIWDWNLSFGNANGKQGHIAEYWYWPQLDDQQYSYFRRLFEDPDFGQRYVDRLAALRAGVFSHSNLTVRIDALVAELGGAVSRNFERWPILGRHIWPNTFVGRTYQDEINYLKNFTRQRLEWIDRQFVAAPMLAETSRRETLTLKSSAGQIYFTLDGTDPRAPGGNVSDRATLYTVPVTVTAKARVFARALHEARWSAPLRR